MNVAKALRDARALLAVHGLRGWTVALDNGKRRAGACHYSKRTITLSRYLTEMHSEDEVRNTILHEIAHALCPGQGHNHVWRRMCLSIGGNGKAYHNAAVVQGRYEGTCPNGHKSYRHRMTRGVKAGASCGKCNPHRFDERYRLVWVDRGLQVR